jgi:hypothetical protein
VQRNGIVVPVQIQVTSPKEDHGLQRVNVVGAAVLLVQRQGRLCLLNGDLVFAQ